MGKVYRINTLNGEVEYVNTVRETERHKDGYESVDRVDAAEECNRLNEEIAEAERTFNRVRLLLIELVEMCPDEVLATGAGARAKKFVDENPLPPATDAHRDGERSYGGG